MNLADKKAVITGSSTGIGRAIALKFAQQGADVLIHGRSPSDNLESLCAEIQSQGRTCETIHQDFSEPFDLAAFAKSAFDKLQGIDVWVNNAGADVLTGSLVELTLPEKLDWLFRVDVSATLQLSQAVGQLMQSSTDSNEESGTRSIINIGWDQAWQGMAGESGELFATTKGAIMSMTKSLAQTLAPKVRVNCIAPGWIQTKWGSNTSDYWNERACRESLMKRWGRADDVANVAAFLASDQASFISAQVINVNGGFNYQPQQEKQGEGSA